MHMAGGGMHRGGGGRGDARASCASPLGTPLTGTVKYKARKRNRYELNTGSSLPDRTPIIWLSWILIRNGNKNPDQGSEAMKSAKIITY